MKAFTLFFLLAAGALAAPEADRSGWQWRQAVTVAEPGIVRVDLPPETLDASQESLSDLRLVSPSGVETPYLIDQVEAVRGGGRAGSGFSIRMVDDLTVLEARTEGVIESVLLESPASGFLKGVSVEAAKAGDDWEMLVSSAVIFRQPSGAERMGVPIREGDWERIRVTVDDRRSAAVPFTGLRVKLAGEEPPTVPQVVGIVSSAEEKRSTRIRLNAGERHLQLADLRLEVDDPVFSRRCSVVALLPDEDGEVVERRLASGVIYRVVDGEMRVEELTIPMHVRIPSRELMLVIENEDSPPLGVRSVLASRYPTSLVAYGAEAGEWSLLTGNHNASAPRYDIAGLRGELSKAEGKWVEPGALMARSEFQKPPTLPGVRAGGAEIDLAEWGFLRPVEGAPAGVIRFETDALVCSRSRSDLGDLRVIQDGRQVPYLLEAATESGVVMPEVVEDPDPKRPSVSRWKVNQPFEDLPVSELMVDSPTPLFRRSFRVVVAGEDDFGHPWTRTLGTGAWTKTSTSDRRFRLDLGGYRMPRSFHLETDNGDNEAIALGEMELRFGKSFVVFKRTDAGPMFLYYGNRSSGVPRYDLSLVRAELLSAEKQLAVLGDEEVLGPVRKARKGEVSAGSPWLWLALALVVALLLVVVAKLLPRGGSEDGGESSGGDDIDGG